MSIHKMPISIILIILGATLFSSGASTNLQESDLIGRMPEITVTAFRYEPQDEAWLGMVEGLVVEAQRHSNGENEIIPMGEFSRIVGGNMSSKDDRSTSGRLRDAMYPLIPLTFTLVTLSIAYISLRVYLAAREVKHDGTKD
jgi:hypothetical protein